MAGRVQFLSVEGFRSIRGLEIKFDDVNLITGPNGCGKSNLFNALKLVKSAFEGRLAAALVDEGGLPAVLWAGDRQKGPIRMKVAVAIDPFEYSLDIGLRPHSEFPLFPGDPQIKEEIVKLAGRVLVERKTSVAHMRDVSGEREMRIDLLDTESILAQISDPERYPTLYTLRELVSKWTFYHEFRTDSESSLRRPAVGTYSPKLREDGSNLAPTLHVIAKQGNIEPLNEILGRAFPESRFEFCPETIQMTVPGINRVIEAREFSDGTLKFLALAAACFAKRPSAFVAFNEPESSLSPAAIEPLADLLTHAYSSSQLWITTHSEELAAALVNRTACRPIRLTKEGGETTLEGRSMRKGYWIEDG